MLSTRQLCLWTSIVLLVLAKQTVHHAFSAPVDGTLWLLGGPDVNALNEIVRSAEDAEPHAWSASPSRADASLPGVTFHSLSASLPHDQGFLTSPVHFLAYTGQTPEGLPHYVHPDLFRLVPPPYENDIKLLKGSSSSRQLVLDKFRKDFIELHGFDADIYWVDDPVRFYGQPHDWNLQRWDKNPRHHRVIRQIRLTGPASPRRNAEDSNYIVNDYLVHFRVLRHSDIPTGRQQFYVIALPLLDLGSDKRGVQIEYASIEVGVLEAPTV